MKNRNEMNEIERPIFEDYKDEIHHPNGVIEDSWRHGEYVDDLEQWGDEVEKERDKLQKENEELREALDFNELVLNIIPSEIVKQAIIYVKKELKQK